MPAPPATAPQPHAIPNQAARQADDIPTPTSLLLRRNGHWDVHKLSTREAGVEVTVVCVCAGNTGYTCVGLLLSTLVLCSNNPPTTLQQPQSVLDEVTSMLRAGDAALRSDYSTARAALQKPGVLEEHELQVLFDDPNVFVQQHIPAHGRAGLHGIVRLPCGDAHHVDRS